MIEKQELMRADRAQGMTYKQISEKYGVSKQRVQQLVGGDTKHAICCFRGITEKDCIYPNLRKWMNDNKISKAELCRRMYGTSHPQCQDRLRVYLKGLTNPTKLNIDRLIKVTGLTYEELFKE